MISNYFLVTLRNIAQHKGYSVINILGLAVGLACSGLLMLWVTGELQYDRFHDKANRIYRVTNRLRLGTLDRSSPNTMAPAGPAMVEEIPGVEAAVRMGMSGTLWVKQGDRIFSEDSAYYSDNSIFRVFSFTLNEGDPETALEAPYSAVITRTLAHKYFGDENPIGKLLRINGNDDFTVTGILDDIPANSHWRFNMLLSFETLYAQDRQLLEMWNRMAYFTYILLDEKAGAEEVEKQFPILIDKYLGELLASRGATQELFLQPLTEIHLHSSLENDPFAGGSINYVYTFSVIAFIVLLVACLNFVNLMTARSSTRAREVALRKTFGATRMQLIGQFLCEAVFISIVAMFLGIILLALVLPKFNEITGYQFSLAALLTPFHLLTGIVLALLTGLLAGIYPAVFISSFSPARVLRGDAVFASRSDLRRAMIVFQFAVSVALIIGTVVVQRQINFMLNADQGFNAEDIIVIGNIDNSKLPSLDILKQKLTTIEGVEGVSASSTAPGAGGMLISCVPEGFNDNDAEMILATTVDADFIPLFQMRVIEGRNFSDEMLTDTAEAVIINEIAAKRFGWDEPIGKIIRLTSRGSRGKVMLVKKVVGVIKDYHNESMHTPIGPLLLERSDNYLRTVSIKLDHDNVRPAMERIESTWSEIAPDLPFDYFFLQENIEGRYSNERRLGRIILYFSLLAVFINVLGLIGMASFSTERRTKEIGIRKVLGATVPEIVRILCWETGILILIGNVVAWPLAFMALNRWLPTFAYRIQPRIADFVLAAVLSASFALVTVSILAFRAAHSNPVISLRQE